MGHLPRRRRLTALRFRSIRPHIYSFYQTPPRGSSLNYKAVARTQVFRVNQGVIPVYSESFNARVYLSQTLPRFHGASQAAPCLIEPASALARALATLMLGSLR